MTWTELEPQAERGDPSATESASALDWLIVTEPALDLSVSCFDDPGSSAPPALTL